MRDLAVMESKSTVFRNRKCQVARDDVGLKKVTWEGVEGGGKRKRGFFLDLHEIVPGSPAKHQGFCCSPAKKEEMAPGTKTLLFCSSYKSRTLPKKIMNLMLTNL